MENLEKTGQWRKIDVLGKGSFATVYEIVRTDALGEEEHAALKVISIPTTATEIAAQRDDGMDDASITAYYQSQVQEITREFKLMAQMKGHSNIVSYEDHGVLRHKNDPGWDILIRMELLAPLPNYYKANFEGHEIREDVVIRLGIDMCKALELCEKHKIIHRDIKPQNIFISRNGDFKLGDFGIARVAEKTTKATKAGTYSYMAPEVYTAQPYNASVDLYSLGLVMHWMLNQRRAPFVPLPPDTPTAEQNTAALQARMSGKPIPAPRYGSPALHEIILKACAYSPADRYHSPREMRQALEALKPGEWIPGIIPLGCAPAPGEKKDDSGDTIGVYPGPGPKPKPPVPSKNIYRVIFRKEDGEILSDKEYLEGAQMDAVHPADWEDAKYRYTFVGWKPSPGGLTVHKSGVYTAQYQKKRKKSRLPYVAAGLAVLLALTGGGITIARLLGRAPTQVITSPDNNEAVQSHQETAAEVQLQSDGDNTSFSAQPLSIDDDDDLQLLEDGYACIGYYDVEIRGLKGVARITFPVDSTYEGKTVKIAHISDTGLTDTTSAVVKDGEITVATTDSSPYMLQVKPQTGRNWSEWTDQLPAGVSGEDYVIETALLSHSREKETTTSEKEQLSGWTLEDVEIRASQGEETSEWSTTPITPSEGVEVEQRTEYRYRDRQTKVFTSIPSEGGWQLESTTSGETTYSEPSEWSTEYPKYSPDIIINEKTQYRYRTISTSTEYTPYGEPSPWQDAAISDDDLTKVETRTAYHYYYYVCSNCGAHMHGYGQCYAWAGGCGKNTVDRGSYHIVRYTTPYQDAQDFHGTTVYYAYGDEGIAFAYIDPSSPHYVAPLTQYRYQKRTAVTVENESEPSPWSDTPYYESDTRKVETRQLYSYQKAETSNNYLCYKWDEKWSPWSTTEYTESVNRQVEMRVVYRSSRKDENKIYHYWRWPDTWSDWSFTAPAESEDVQVESAVCYRYCRKS